MYLLGQRTKTFIKPQSIALLLALIGISWAAPLARLAGVDGYTAAWWRLLVGTTITLLAHIVFIGKPKFEKNWALISVLSGVFLALHFALWLESLRHMTVSSSTGIVVSYPIIAGLYDALVSREITTKKFLGVVIGFLGVLVLSTPWAGATLFGGILSFTAAIMAAAYIIIGRKVRKEEIPTLSYTLVAYGSALLFLTSFTLVGRQPWNVPQPSIPFLILLGIVPMLLGHSMINYSLRYYPASAVATVTLLEPYGAGILAWLVIGEPVPPVTAIGALLTITGAKIVLSSPTQ